MQTALTDSRDNGFGAGKLFEFVRCDGVNESLELIGLLDKCLKLPARGVAGFVTEDHRDLVASVKIASFHFEEEGTAPGAGVALVVPAGMNLAVTCCSYGKVVWGVRC
jgi:hypothetical protein